MFKYIIETQFDIYVLNTWNEILTNNSTDFPISGDLHLSRAVKYINLVLKLSFQISYASNP